MKKISIINAKNLSYLIWSACVYYLSLCLLHFFSARPLWLDENFIFNYIKTVSPMELFGSLGSQAFPRVYLIIVQLFSRMFDYNIYALRFLPLVAMMAAFYMWLRVYRKAEGRGIGYLLFILTWCGSTFMSYYAAELKQYSLEVFISGIFAYLLLSQKTHLQNNETKKHLIFAYLFTPFLVLFSYTAYFLLLIPLYNLFLSLRSSKRNLSYLCVYMFSMIIAVVISYMFDVRFVHTTSGMWNYWNDYFISTSSIPEFLQTFTEGIRNVFARWILEEKLVRRIMTVFMPFALIVAIIGGIKEFKENKGYLVSLKSITLFLVCSLALAGALKLYPFTGARVTLYIAPFIFYCMIKGIELFRNKFYWAYCSLTALYVITLCSTSVFLMRKYILLYQG